MPYKTLLEVLREDLRSTGTKHGCELGECGACAVLVDGRAGAFVPRARRRVRRRRASTTVEGMATDGRAPSAAGGVRGSRRRAVRLLHARDSLTAKALLDENPQPDARSRSAKRSPGNLCRCTGYQQIFEAVEAGGRKIREVPRFRLRRQRLLPSHGPAGAGLVPPDQGERRRAVRARLIGTPRRRVDARAKVTGQTKFADDLVLPRMLHCKLLRSKVAARAHRPRSTPRGRAARPACISVADRRRFPDSVRHPAGVARTSTRSARTACASSAIPWPPSIARDESTAFERARR